MVKGMLIDRHRLDVHQSDILEQRSLSMRLNRFEALCGTEHVDFYANKKDTNFIVDSK